MTANDSQRQCRMTVSPLATQEAVAANVTRHGWAQLFAVYDTDGSGQVRGTPLYQRCVDRPPARNVNQECPDVAC